MLPEKVSMRKLRSSTALNVIPVMENNQRPAVPVLRNHFDTSVAALMTLRSMSVTVAQVESKSAAIARTPRATPRNTRGIQRRLRNQGRVVPCLFSGVSEPGVFVMNGRHRMERIEFGVI